MVRRVTSECPMYPHNCDAAAPRQVRLERQALVEAGLNGDWLGNAFRCTYCDHIYSIGANGMKVHQGHFGGNTLMEADNWVPYRR